MSRIWKIAPGNHAEDWPVFSELGCIGIGWLTEYDFREFKNEADIHSTLEYECGKGTPGCGKGAAAMIWSFVHEIELNHVVVANDAYNRAVGIGTIESPYLPPRARNNPLRKDATTHRHHARAVNWIVKLPATIPGGRLFEQRTLAPLDEGKVATVFEAYLDAYPDDAALARKLGRLFDIVAGPKTPKAKDMEDTKPGRVTTTTYRILRDTAKARCVKAVHENKCQICGETIVLCDGTRYSEAHHIKPLGSPHDGPDTITNILCLCPNHHAACDLGAIELSMATLRRVDGHEINHEFIEYHNRVVFGV